MFFIMHLEDEIRIRDEDNLQLREELEKLKARTVLDLLVELKQEIKTADWMAAEARRERDKLQGEHDKMKSKLSMWTKLNGHGV